MIRAAALILALAATPAHAQCPPWHVYMTVFELNANVTAKKAEILDSMVANAFTQVVRVNICISAKNSLGENGIDRDNGARVVEVFCAPCTLTQPEHDQHMEVRRINLYLAARKALERKLSE